MAKNKMTGYDTGLIIFVMLSLMSFIYLFIYGFHTDNLHLIMMASMMIFMTLTGYVITYNFSNVWQIKSTFGDFSFSFMLGAVMTSIIHLMPDWLPFSTTIKSLLGIRGHHILSTISGNVPIFLEYYVTLIHYIIFAF